MRLHQPSNSSRSLHLPFSPLFIHSNISSELYLLRFSTIRICITSMLITYQNKFDKRQSMDIPSRLLQKAVLDISDRKDNRNRLLPSREVHIRLHQNSLLLTHVQVSFQDHAHGRVYVLLPPRVPSILSHKRTIPSLRSSAS